MHIRIDDEVISLELIEYIGFEERDDITHLGDIVGDLYIYIRVTQSRREVRKYTITREEWWNFWHSYDCDEERFTFNVFEEDECEEMDSSCL